MTSVAQGAETYIRQAGLHPALAHPDFAKVVVSPQVGTAVARAYEHVGQSRHARKAFKAMGRETEDQFSFLTRPKEQGGLGMKGMTVIKWVMPCRLYYQRADLNNAVRVLYSAVPDVLLAFAAHVTLFGTCRDAYLTDGRAVGDNETSWWEWVLTASERLDMPQLA